MPKKNRIGPRSRSTRRAIFGRVETHAVSTDMFVSASWRVIFPIIEILVYGLSCVALLRGGMEVLRPCCISAIGVVYLVASGIIGLIGGVRVFLRL